MQQQFHYFIYYLFMSMQNKNQIYANSVVVLDSPITSLSQIESIQEDIRTSPTMMSDDGKPLFWGVCIQNFILLKTVDKE